ncbi:unnamed protein product [Amoebophrya sp. A120]|nr:unnamed protein product [Amoebophrya sp. A120]|eukprot:GSA120T00014573001.1
MLTMALSFDSRLTTYLWVLHFTCSAALLEHSPHGRVLRWLLTSSQSAFL